MTPEERKQAYSDKKYRIEFGHGIYSAAWERIQKNQDTLSNKKYGGMNSWIQI